jgi:hypothetical protein
MTTRPPLILGVSPKAPNSFYNKEKRHQWYLKYRDRILANYREYLRNYYQKNKEKILNQQRSEKAKELRRLRELKYREKRPERLRVRHLVYDAIKAGQLLKQPCSICNDINSHAHHEDYNKPFKIIWLCRRHHADLHIEKRRIAREVTHEMET